MDTPPPSIKTNISANKPRVLPAQTPKTTTKKPIVVVPSYEELVSESGGRASYSDVAEFSDKDSDLSGGDDSNSEAAASESEDDTQSDSGAAGDSSSGGVPSIDWDAYNSNDEYGDNIDVDVIIAEYTFNRDGNNDRKKVTRYSDSESDFIASEDEEDEESDYRGKYHTPAKAKPINPNLKTPSKVASAFKRSVKKDSVVERLFKEYNEKVFSNRLPHDLSITWSKRLLTTAGVTLCGYGTIDGRSVRVAPIELSIKVIDSHKRLVDTLLHELCHSATWLIDQEPANNRHHGKGFQLWGKRVTKVYPDVPCENCHAYQIHKKYQFKCSKETCSTKVHKHSKKGLDINKKVCGHCKSRFVYVGIVNAEGEVAKKREASGFSLYVKAHFVSTKKKFSLSTQAQVMKQLTVLYKQDKEAGTLDRPCSVPTPPPAPVQSAQARQRVVCDLTETASTNNAVSTTPYKPPQGLVSGLNTPFGGDRLWWDDNEVSLVAGSLAGLTV